MPLTQGDNRPLQTGTRHSLVDSGRQLSTQFRHSYFVRPVFRAQNRSRLAAA